MFTIPFGVFLVLIGLIWEPQAKTKKDLKAEHALLEDGEVLDEHNLTPQQMRNYLRRVIMRLLVVVLGVVGIAVGSVRDLDSIDNPNAFALLLALYTFILLVVQRAEKNRRLLVLYFMGFVGFMIWRTADYREHTVENDWAILGSMVINGVFWFLIGRRFPPASSDYIEVIGME